MKMSGLNSSADEVVECPLCMEPLEVDDLNFYPCTCGYQICRFCWHRIRTDENELCPACRKAYPENPADFTPLTQEEMIAFKSQKRQRDQQRKQKITENRKHLANVRVVQKNLVFVVGLPPRLADADILKKHEYFGKYGKIHKVVINPSTTYAGVQGPSASAYVTYVNNSDALRAIQSVNNINIDGRPIKTSLGTTKYCSHFMKNQQCPKSDCMYLHELGDPEASFTKEEMHQGKHQEYEKRLHENLLANSALASNGTCHSTGGINHSGAVINNNTSAADSMPAQQKEAWPSLSLSPTNKDSNTILNGKAKKDRMKHQDKLKVEKSIKVKSKSGTSASNSATTNKESLQSTKSPSSADKPPGQNNSVNQNKKNEKIKSDKTIITQQNHENQEYEDNLADDQKNKRSNAEEKKKIKNCNNQNCKIDFKISTNVENPMIEGEGDCERSLSSSSNASITSNNSNTSFGKNIKRNTLEVDDNNSGKSSPVSINSVEKSAPSSQSYQQSSVKSNGLPDIKTEFCFEDKSTKNMESSETFKDLEPIESTNNAVDGNTLNDTTVALSNLNLFDDHNSFFSSSVSSLHQCLLKSKLETEMRQNQTNNSFTSQLPDLLSGIDGFQSNATNPDEMQKSLKSMGMIRNNKQLEEELNQHQMQQQLQQQEELLRIHEIQTRNNLINNIGISQIVPPHNDLQNIGNNAFDSSDNNRVSQAALLQQQILHQPHQTHQSDHLLGNNLFGMNMSKFFDFHKNQQQQIHQQFMLNGGHNNTNTSGAFNDHLRLNTLLENNRINSQFLERNNSLLPAQQTTQHQIQKQRLKYEPSPNVQQTNGQQNPQNQQNRVGNQFSQNTSADDDLGFDPFIETQKALAELMENELVQQQNISMPQSSTTQSVSAKLLHQQQQQQQHMLENMQRTRLPPPGFNHMNSFPLGVPRTQNANKMLPFTNGGNSAVGSTPIANANWNSHLAAFPQQPQQLNEAQIQQLVLNQNSGNHKGYGSNDWTAMDPAILSFRQFSFPQQSHMPHTPHQQDFFLQNMPQQQNIQGFGGSQGQLHCGNLNLSNGIINSQQAPSGQVNANVQGMLEYLKNRQFI